MLVLTVSVELRLGAQDVSDKRIDWMDIFEERRERLLDMMSADSCSEMGDGPGKGGKGATGGREGGGLTNVLIWRERVELGGLAGGGWWCVVERESLGEGGM